VTSVNNSQRIVGCRQNHT